MMGNESIESLAGSAPFSWLKAVSLVSRPVLAFVTESFSAVEPLDDDVLAIFEGERVLRLAIARQIRLRFAELILLAFQLVGNPPEHLVGVLQAEIEVLLRVFLGERVGGLRGEIRIAVTVEDA